MKKTPIIFSANDQEFSLSQKLQLTAISRLQHHPGSPDHRISFFSEFGAAGYADLEIGKGLRADLKIRHSRTGKGLNKIDFSQNFQIAARPPGNLQIAVTP